MAKRLSISNGVLFAGPLFHVTHPRSVLYALAILVTFFWPGIPQEACGQASTGGSYLTVDGEVTTPLNLSQSDFKGLPRSSTKVKDSGGQESTYEGVLLAELLTRAGVPLKNNLKGADVGKYLHAEGTDGFVAVFSLPEFDQTDFLVADTVNGTPLPMGEGPLQIISPNEMRHSRWVKKLMLLRVKKSAK
jgi:DMSO/TMAO reductase YedYZ molybdopterin-dependent catalytic subunit